MSDLDLYSSLVLKGEAEEIEIVSAYLEKLCLGVNINEGSTSIYFKNVDKKKIDHIIRGCSNLVSWAWENIEAQDWMHNWKPYFKDVFIKDRVVIVPNWLINSPHPNVSVGHLCNPFKVEMVIRG